MIAFEDITISDPEGKASGRLRYQPDFMEYVFQLSYDPPKRWSEIFNEEYRSAIGYGFKLSRSGIGNWFKGLTKGVEVKRNQMYVSGTKRDIERFAGVANYCINRTNARYRKHLLDLLDKMDRDRPTGT